MNLQDLQNNTWSGRADYSGSDGYPNGNYVLFKDIVFVPRSDVPTVLQAVNSTVIACVGGQENPLCRHWQAMVRPDGAVRFVQIDLAGKALFDFRLVAPNSATRPALTGIFHPYVEGNVSVQPHGTCSFLGN